MKVGDLVARKIPPEDAGPYERATSLRQLDELGFGIVLSQQISGRPRHKCLTVWYPKTGGIWDIAESLVEVISEANG